MYEVGKVYIWQNQVKEKEYINGTECTVTSHPKKQWSIAVGNCIAQDTDKKWKDLIIVTRAGDLRPKNLPSGEKLVRDMFQPKPVMETA